VKVLIIVFLLTNISSKQTHFDLFQLKGKITGSCIPRKNQMIELKEE
jgi:hypothetical protein